MTDNKLILLTIVFVIAMLFRNCMVNAAGIHPHPSGEAVYIEGAGCTINMVGEYDLQEMNERYIWCTDRHDEYLNNSK